MLDAGSEKGLKQRVCAKLRGRECAHVAISFSGSMEQNDLKVNLNGPEDEVAEAQKRLLKSSVAIVLDGRERRN